jgi:chemotaxis protein MotB
MKFLSLLILSFALFACVPAKKYNDLLSKEKRCSEELAKYKSSALDNEGMAKTLAEQNKVLTEEISALQKDTLQLGNKYRMLQSQYDKANELAMTLEREFEKAKSKDALETAKMTADLEAKILEAQRKEDALLELERELNKKERLLAEREARVKELEEIIAKQEAAVNALKEKIALALRGFTDKGLTVEEKDGKIYVSLEAKLLFASGSTFVESEGKKAIIQLAQAIEGDDQLEIIVEGHTDADALKSNSHPKNNWELSVLRATSVVDIMIENSTIEPKILTAAGRSSFHPVSETDKAKNRRIEVIIAPNLNALFEIIGQ